uniref:Uncharacterized protein n=1 Tax=Oryza punctata TaxID=4537 RepID=A0A0E0JNI4_ORYPU
MAGRRVPQPSCLFSGGALRRRQAGGGWLRRGEARRDGGGEREQTDESRKKKKNPESAEGITKRGVGGSVTQGRWGPNRGGFDGGARRGASSTRPVRLRPSLLSIYSASVTARVSRWEQQEAASCALPLAGVAGGPGKMGKRHRRSQGPASMGCCPGSASYNMSKAVYS